MKKQFFLTTLIILFYLVCLFCFNSSGNRGQENSVKNNNEQDLFLAATKSFTLESPDFLLIGKNTIAASSPAVIFSPQVLGALVGAYETEDVKKAIVEYIVEAGDNLWSISYKFDITLDTLLWANDLNENSLIQPGQKLVVLPVSGIIHYVKAGDTISEIAQKYEVKTSDIIAFNELFNEADIFIGDILIILEGKMPEPAAQYVAAVSSASVPLANSYFICPISAPCHITQGLHWYNAIDFSNGKCGDAIYAAAGGKVLKVKLTTSVSRWVFGGAGNHITILHPNGVVTMYGHISKALVSPGQQVSQGQIIALMGGEPGTPGAGMSTGCHVHFGVYGARNPFQ